MLFLQVNFISPYPEKNFYSCKNLAPLTLENKLKHVIGSDFQSTSEFKTHTPNFSRKRRFGNRVPDFTDIEGEIKSAKLELIKAQV